MDFKRMYKARGFKYIVATVIFLVVILFIDPNHLLVTHRLGRQVKELRAEEQALRHAIVDDSAAAANLRDNPDAIEHYGRENYYMKRPNEDIFVIR